MIAQLFALLCLLASLWSTIAFQQLSRTNAVGKLHAPTFPGDFSRRFRQRQPNTPLQLHRNIENHPEQVENALQSKLSTVAAKSTCSLLLVALCLSFSSAAWADNEETTSTSTTTAPPITVQLCVRNEPGVPTNCVSTANVRQYDLYSPPWTFASSISAPEVSARLKGAIQNTYGRDLVDLTQSGDSSIQAHVTRNLIATDELEFVVNPKDRVVIFSARETSPTPRVSDFGALRQRLEQIRKTAGVFGVMGDALQDTADGTESSYYESLKQDQSPLGQLKAFYGLQSGEGFEDVFDD